MLLALAALAFQTATLPNYVDVLRGMHTAYRSQKGFHEEWATGEGKDKTTLTRDIDGPRFHWLIKSANGPIAEACHDGLRSAAVVYYSKSYDTQVRRNDSFTNPFKLGPKSSNSLDSGSFGFADGYDFSIVSNDEPKIESVENIVRDGEKMRLFRIDWRIENQPFVKIRMTFESKEWILRGYELDGAKGPDGKPTQMVATAKVTRGLTFKDTDFFMDPKKYEGFQKAFPPLVSQ